MGRNRFNILRRHRRHEVSLADYELEQFSEQMEFIKKKKAIFNEFGFEKVQAALSEPLDPRRKCNGKYPPITLCQDRRRSCFKQWYGE